MKKYFTIITLALLCCDLHSQHEYKISIGSAISGDSNYANGIVAGSYILYNDVISDNSYSSRIGLNFNLEYSYYIKYNLKVSANLGYSQLGYRSTQNEYYGQSTGQNFTSDNKININCIETGIGMTFITKQGITFTMGYSAYNLDNTTINQVGSSIYTSNPSNNEIIDQTLTFDEFQNNFDDSYSALPSGIEINSDLFAPFFGVGYEWGDFSIDCNYVTIPNYASAFVQSYDLTSLSLCIGYSKIIKSKK